jgi:OOP family OmpA-OmpF porin
MRARAMAFRSALVWMLLSLGLVACTPLSRVTLLPEPEGRATAVLVQGVSGAQVLDQPYAMAAVQRTGVVDRAQTTVDEVKQRHGALLALQPPGVQRFVLQFEPGTATLTPESQAQLPGILVQARALPGGELVVVGHTDRTGSPQANDVLSQQRAQSVRNLLIAQGFQPELIEAVGRGEREPVVPTEANVDEPRNRRAEIIVR